MISLPPFLQTLGEPELGIVGALRRYDAITPMAESLGAEELVSRSDGKPVWVLSKMKAHGGLVFARVGKNLASIYRLYVTKDFRRHGIATALLNEFVDALDEYGVDCRLSCQPFELKNRVCENNFLLDWFGGEQKVEEPGTVERMKKWYGKFGFEVVPKNEVEMIRKRRRR